MADAAPLLPLIRRLHERIRDRVVEACERAAPTKPLRDGGLSSIRSTARAS